MLNRNETFGDFLAGCRPQFLEVYGPRVFLWETSISCFERELSSRHTCQWPILFSHYKMTWSTTKGFLRDRWNLRLTGQSWGGLPSLFAVLCCCTCCSLNLFIATKLGLDIRAYAVLLIAADHLEIRFGSADARSVALHQVQSSVLRFTAFILAKMPPSHDNFVCLPKSYQSDACITSTAIRKHSFLDSLFHLSSTSVYVSS